jgi:uncharacterized protein YjbJ (UPF0337 family)
MSNNTAAAVITKVFPRLRWRNGAAAKFRPATCFVGFPAGKAVLGWTPNDKQRRENETMAERNGVEESVEGVVEGVKGKAKEVAGKVTDRDDLHREGQAQQDKADAQREAGKKESAAESARGAAKANEAREAAEQ